MKQVSTLLLGIVFVVSSSAAFGQNQSAIAVKDGMGRVVALRATAQRIVSTTPSNTEILYDLGLKDKVVAVSSHCGKTCDVTGKAVIGGWAEPAIVQGIVAQKPDLVLGFGGLQSPLAREMEKRDIPVFMFFPTTVDETLQQILLVGKVTGTEQKAEEIVGRCRRRLKEIEDRLEGIPLQNRVKCVRLMSTQAMVIGGTSFQSDIIKKAGGVNVFEDVKDAYPVVGLENVKAKDPDVIMLNRDDEEAAIRWFLEQPGWSDLRAARARRVMSISCDYICHPNTRIDKTVEMLARRFYPERFKND
jgi:iron complex transport system substrate-binding protein